MKPDADQSKRPKFLACCYAEGAKKVWGYCEECWERHGGTTDGERTD